MIIVLIVILVCRVSTKKIISENKKALKFSIKVKKIIIENNEKPLTPSMKKTQCNPYHDHLGNVFC